MTEERKGGGGKGRSPPPAAKSYASPCMHEICAKAEVKEHQDVFPGPKETLGLIFLFTAIGSKLHLTYGS